MLQIPYLTRLYIIWKILAEKTCLQQVLNTFTMAKYAKNRNYVPPSTKGETVLVRPSKNKDGVVKQDWDVYIGHGLNNKHWVLEKSKWSNPFYTPKLSAKICNERYRRHILSSKHLQASLKELVGKRLGCLCPNLDECHGNVLIELVHKFFPSESEMRGYILCHQYLFFKGQRSPLSNCYVHDIKTQDGTFINVHQMYGWKKLLLWGKDLWPRISWKREIPQRFSSY